MKICEGILKRFFGRVVGDKIWIEGDEFIHLKNVLRFKEEEEVLVSTGQEMFFHVKIAGFKKSAAVCEVIGTCICEANPKKKVTLFIASAKGEKTELVLQKCTELGIDSLVLFDSEFSVKRGVNLERLKKISLEACKQCGRSLPMDILGIIPFAEMAGRLSLYSRVIFANERETDRGLKDIGELFGCENLAIIIGCEGGFSREEEKVLLEKKEVISVSLGKRILRCETAAIVLAGYTSFVGGI